MAEVKKIMVAVDESEFSHYALEWALNNLQLYGKDVSLVVLHAQPFIAINSAATMGVTPPELIEVLLNQQKQVSEALLARAKEICAQKNVNVETMVEIGDPKDAICDAAEKMQIDLLVLGNHGYGMVKRALLGSVSSYCVHHAKCPVLVVRKPS
ncbi:hypothetical protein SUGI_0143650 [Cryptomeria japonica]|uniref:uncharacterized protein LOC131075349 n=1 Tax=Cryptomeria japonica TaxID=3369 RepID=UPI002408F027|nr:uncharacterized protein LOC131075349 [Cryptomeria japonica]GLJ11121.1 hypothetical protein SUGI_0143650 [Cryptomeria japonica]